MFNEQGKLSIFENFLIDHSLPKFNKKQRNMKYETSMTEEQSESVGEHPWSRARLTTNSGIIVEPFSPKQYGFWFKFSFWLLNLFNKKKEPKPTITIEQFFASVKNSTEQLEVVKQRAIGYEKAIDKAKETGQTALFENLKRNLVAVRAEAQLVAIGLNKFIREEKIVEFVKKAKKGVRLDWISNFVQSIPDALRDKKLECDKLFIFDNYVILHYDPEMKSWAETEAERVRRKDPILFGLIEGRHQLYYIGDWVNEFCDLTLDQVADIIGKDNVGTLNDPKDSMLG